MKLEPQNKDTKFDPSDWQGRSARQVEDNYKILEWIFGAAAIGFFSWVIYMVYQNLVG